MTTITRLQQTPTIGQIPLAAGRIAKSQSQPKRGFFSVFTRVSPARVKKARLPEGEVESNLPLR